MKTKDIILIISLLSISGIIFAKNSKENSKGSYEFSKAWTSFSPSERVVLFRRA